MVQLVKSTRDFEIFGAQPWHRQGERSTACDKLSRVELTPKSPKIQKPQ
jgi:hypothetical protein